MVCSTCASAADRRAPRSEHCDDPRCMCGHRVERYGPLNGFVAVAAMYDGLARIVDQTAEIHPRAAVRPLGEPFRFPPMVRYLAEGKDPDDVQTVIPADILSRHEQRPAEAVLVEQRKCKVIVPHPFKQVPDVNVRVCACTKWPDHHIHTGDRAACTCDECHTEPTATTTED